MKTTITDVARQAGVSIKTVSRVLNDEPNVAEATRAKVVKAAGELQYAPNLAARGLAGSRSYMLALIYDNPNPSYIAGLQGGAVAACRRKGYRLVLEPMTQAAAEAPDVALTLRRLGVDGVIVSPPLSASDSLLAALADVGLPHVAIASSPIGSVPTVHMDDAEAAHRMTCHLIDHGHGAIGFVAGPDSHPASSRRREGFVRAMTEAGLAVPAVRMAQGDFTFDSGVRAGRTLLSQGGDRPTAIFATNDDMAAGVMAAATEAGFAIPDDLSVGGFDDTPIARMIRPGLTTIAQPIRDMGAAAAMRLIARPVGDGSDADAFGFDLAVRGSTGPAPT
ncbi:LacI family DNA-binding transcriptional regulator [uncultured Algimonas sp.]|uniref:LacI family DNA-binding transcriptional regulator n=1 Tax=uncultured Algimonas sp. TaxID=1547920 RepID=UPI0026380DCA|nr:LacI family DNA-binding transcriptional regulator [uncultured Algimonas sp.]